MKALYTGANSSRIRRLLRVTAVVCTIVLVPILSAQDFDNPAPHNAMSPVGPPGPLPEPFRIGSPRAQTSQSASTPSPSALLYRQLRDVHVDPKRVFHIREASIEREDLHITLEDGVIGFTQTVAGRVTGAFFEGDGEVLIMPPDRVERRSVGLFTKTAILEEHFTSAFFRFDDDLQTELADSFRGEEPNAQEFVSKWDGTVHSLAEGDALRLLASFVNGTGADGKITPRPDDHVLHVRVNGTKLGVFDVFYDTAAREQISVGQVAHSKAGETFFNTWTSFPMRSRWLKSASTRVAKNHKTVSPAALGSTVEEEPEERVRITDYAMKVDVNPPTDLSADCTMDIDVVEGGDRVLMLELSRFLKVGKVEVDGKPVEYLQNEALEGTALARRGNDLVAVIFPEVLKKGEKLHLHMTYAGSVMSDAGGGLLYVGAKGIWYPNRGLAMANFDIQFKTPTNWTLVATGKNVSKSESGGIETSRWVSERPIPLAGFNLGHYQKASARYGKTTVEVYASAGVENAMDQSKQIAVAPVRPVGPGDARAQAAFLFSAPDPEPARHAQFVANRVEKSLEALSSEIGPYPYSSLVLSQMPGTMSQGWPGLIYLSSYVFLTPEELQHTHVGGVDEAFFSTLMPIHETAHQWWGDEVAWRSYRDQWIVEALANYCALAAMEKDQPRAVTRILQNYRRQLLTNNPEGVPLADAGPVTLGVRLTSSDFPRGYDTISYGRGTWLFHMLRTMLRDAEERDERANPKKPKPAEEPFFRVLHKICERYNGKFINNRVLKEAFEEELPESLRYDGKKSLDWFFDEWVNGTAIPKIEMSDLKFTHTANGSFVSGKLLQKEAPPELVTSVPIYAVMTGKNPLLLGRIFADGNESSFRLKVPVGTKKVELDPYETVLRRP